MPKSRIIIIGAGVIGLTIASRLKTRAPKVSITIIDKENREAIHASSRNSGILHSGFYYSENSLKAKFCVEGNRAWREFCAIRKIPIKAWGKLVVATAEDELSGLHELFKRGKANGVNLDLVSADQARKYEPRVLCHKEALWSPNTASIDPVELCAILRRELEESGVQFRFKTSYLGKSSAGIETTLGSMDADFVINCAGLYADKIARDFGFAANYTMLPFKGFYLKYSGSRDFLSTNIYPVPDARFPFLGVHCTKISDGSSKIGPTAIPAFWREQYKGLSRFRLSEFAEILSQEAKLFVTNRSHFRNLAVEEMRKYSKKYLISLAQNLVSGFEPNLFQEYTPPGIRAQLFELKTNTLVQDFIIEGDSSSVHVLNAVSPGFTCSLPFADHVINNFVSTLI